MNILLKILRENQYIKIGNKTRHKKLYRPKRNAMVDMVQSSLCMTHDNTYSKHKAHL